MVVVKIEVDSQENNVGLDDYDDISNDKFVGRHAYPRDTSDRR